MFGFWPVARQTFLEAVRARVTTVFGIALAAVVVLTPMVAASGTLISQVQTFLVYSVGLAGVLLSAWTILLGCSLISSEVQTRQIFGPMTKPVSRWQYVLGRWLGVVLLQAVLVGLVGVGVYAMTQYVSHRPAPDQERHMLGRQVLTARTQHSPEPVDPRIERYVQQRWQSMSPEQRQRAADEFGGGSEGEAQALAALRQRGAHTVQTARPMEQLQWEFTGLRRPSHQTDYVQFTYQASTAEDPPGNILHSVWVFANPQTSRGYVYQRSDSLGDRATIQVTPEAISDDGRMIVQFHNVDPRGPNNFRTSVAVPADEIFVLYPVAGFTGNFVRGMAQMLMLQVFLAGLAILASSFLSFPVATLACFVLFVIGLAHSFIQDSTKLNAAADGWTLVGHYAAKAIYVLLPNFDRGSPTDAFAEGLLISWGTLGMSALLLLPVAGFLLLAGLIFSRRELAGVTA